MLTAREPISFEELLAALARGDDLAVIEMFRGRTEAERRAVAPALFGLHRRSWGALYGDNRVDPIVPHAFHDTACAALFACGTLTEIKRLRLEHKYGEMCHDATCEVLVDRRPSWVTAWAIWALDRQATPSGRAEGMWTLVRRLMRAGVCDRLDTDGYILGMIFGIVEFRYGSRSRWYGDERRGIPCDDEAIEHHRQMWWGRTVAGALMDDPELLHHEIWRIFEVPGRPSRQLGAPDSDGGDPWIEAFIVLARSGDIDRQRLFWATLDALARDITQYQAGWFIALWRALEPSPADRESVQEHLLHLIAHPVAAVAQFALNQLDALEAGGSLEGAIFVSEVEGVLLTMPVATVRHALRLLDRVCCSTPSARTEALVAVTAALLHDNAKVRDAAATLLAKRATPIEAVLAEAIEANLCAVTSEQAAKLRALI